MAAPTETRGADMAQATGTYGTFLTLLKVLIGVSLTALLILVLLYNI